MQDEDPYYKYISIYNRIEFLVYRANIDKWYFSKLTISNSTDYLFIQRQAQIHIGICSDELDRIVSRRGRMTKDDF